ncbi:hypothetical protein CDAR_503231 [Caerostris darwini]|uniref:Uncharacterized protein n=1 Tax=Caerostris darwini TaxID=1538125 RepID=A0AAV4USI5_9ARAC|nr:hypothetical protein CDAR_503231 [Caerostris darwini]
MFIFALLACIAVSQAWLEHDLPARIPLVSNVPYPYGVVAPAPIVRDVRDSTASVYSAGLGYNYGYNVYDRRFNDVALGYRGAVGLNAPLVGFGAIRGLNAPLVGLGGIRGLNAPLVGFGGVYGLRK